MRTGHPRRHRSRGTAQLAEDDAVKGRARSARLDPRFAGQSKGYVADPPRGHEQVRQSVDVIKPERRENVRPAPSFQFHPSALSRSISIASQDEEDV